MVVCCYKKLNGNGVYRIVPLEYANVPGIDVLNIYLTYNSLKFSGKVTSFTSYLSYTLNGKTVVYTDVVVDFLKNTPVNDYPESGLFVSLPFKGQYAAFTLPLVQIPKGATFDAGFQITTQCGQGPKLRTIYTLPSSDMSPLKVHIYEKTLPENPFQGTALPPVTIRSITTPIQFSLCSSSTTFTLEEQTLMLTVSDWQYALFEDVVSTDNYTTWASQVPSTFYTTPFHYPLVYTTPSGTPPPSYVYPGKWFASTPDGLNEYFRGKEAGQFLLESSKLQNYAVPGLNRNYQAEYSVDVSDPSGVLISMNCIPVNYYGTWPTSNSIDDTPFDPANVVIPCAAVYCDQEPSEVLPVDFTFQLPVPEKATVAQPLTPYALGYLLSNHFLLTAVDSGSVNAGSKESTDLFSSHLDPNWNYHSHLTPSSLTDNTIQCSPTLVAWCMDGFPIVSGIIIALEEAPTDAPYVYKDGRYYQVITSKYLNLYHGLEGSFDIAIPNNGDIVIKNFTFVYVFTPDFPYTVMAFYGTPIVPSESPSTSSTTLT
jgi:hypothetical protein